MGKVIKTSLVDASGTSFNPVSAFARFGFWPHGPESYMSTIRGILCFALALTIGIDWGLIDHLSHYKRESGDGDDVGFMFQPHDWLHIGWVVSLFLKVLVSGTKYDKDSGTRFTRSFLIIWNLDLVLIPLTTVGLIFYYHVVRFNHSNDDAFQATIIQAFIIACFELLWSGWPSEWADIVLPTLVSGVFILYTLAISNWFKLTLYTQLDWLNDPSTATKNAFIFIGITLVCSIVTTLIAKGRNSYYTRFQTGYLPISR